jgi:hypothetical protein
MAAVHFGFLVVHFAGNGWMSESKHEAGFLSEKLGRFKCNKYMFGYKKRPSFYGLGWTIRKLVV